MCVCVFLIHNRHCFSLLPYCAFVFCSTVGYVQGHDVWWSQIYWHEWSFHRLQHSYNSKYEYKIICVSVIFGSLTNWGCTSPALYMKFVCLWIDQPAPSSFPYLKSLFPKGARSIFMTSEKNVFLCASLYTRLWKTQYWVYNIFFLLVTFGSEMRLKGKG